MQAFAGYFQVNTGKVHPLQIPAFRLTLYCKPLTLYCKPLTLGHTKNQLIFLVAASIGGAGSSVKYFGQRATNS